MWQQSVCLSPSRVCPTAAGCLHFHGFPLATVCDYTHPINTISDTYPAGSTDSIKRDHSEALGTRTQRLAVLWCLFGTGRRIKCMVTSKCFSFSKCKYVLKINVIFFWTTTSLHLCMISLRAELRLPEVSCLYFHG